MSHHEDEDDDVKAHEARDWQMIEGDDLEKRAEALLCISRRRGDDPAQQNESLIFAESAEALYRQLDNQPQLFETLWAKADALYALKFFATAMAASLEAAEIAVGLLMDSQAGAMYFNAGGCARNLDEFADAAAYCKKASEYLLAADKQIEAGKALVWLGRNRYTLEEFDAARDAYLAAIQIFETEGAMGKLAECSRSLAKAYIGNGDFDLADQALTRAEAITEFVPDDVLGEKVKFARGLLLAAKGEHQKAITAFEGLYETGLALGIPEFTTKTAFERAKSEMAIGLYEPAAATFRKLAVALDGTPSPIKKHDALLQLLKVRELQENAVDQEKVILELFEISEIAENPVVMNLLNLQLGMVLSTTAGDPLALKVLETLPRDSFPSGSIDWLEHSMALLRNYFAFARDSECLYLANDVLMVADAEFFEDFVAEIHAIKAQALARIGESECAQREAKLAYDLLLKTGQFEAAKTVHQTFLVTKRNEIPSAEPIDSVLGRESTSSRSSSVSTGSRINEEFIQFEQITEPEIVARLRAAAERYGFVISKEQVPSDPLGE